MMSLFTVFCSFYTFLSMNTKTEQTSQKATRRSDCLKTHTHARTHTHRSSADGGIHARWVVWFVSYVLKELGEITDRTDPLNGPPPQNPPILT